GGAAAPESGGRRPVRAQPIPGRGAIGGGRRGDGPRGDRGRAVPGRGGDHARRDRGARPRGGGGRHRHRQGHLGHGRAGVVRRLAVALAATLLLAGCGGSSHLTVFAAISLKTAFESYGGARFSFAGSDELAAQIRQGSAPDVYAAANM